MKKLVLLLSLLMLACATARAQTVVGGAGAPRLFAWDISAPDLQTANAYTYKYYPDGGAGVVFTGVSCLASRDATTFVCTVSIPAFTPGNHVVQVTAANVAGESDKSETLGFVFVVVPGAPVRLRIQ